MKHFRKKPKLETERSMPYYLKFWGQASPVVLKELGITDTDFWFKTAKERDKFHSKVEKIAESHSQIIVFRQAEGEMCEYTTVAKMKLVYKGIPYPFEYDFGYGCEEDDVKYMFFEGNYCCDCNRSTFLREKHPEVPSLECGDEIELKDWEITYKHRLDKS